MAETKKTEEATKCVNCEELQKQLDEANEKIKQYEEAYKKLQTRYTRLYGILGNQIEYSLGIE